MNWLATQKLQARLPAVPLQASDLGQVVHTHASVTKQYNLVSVAQQ